MHAWRTPASSSASRKAHSFAVSSSSHPPFGKIHAFEFFELVINKSSGSKSKFSCEASSTTSLLLLIVFFTITAQATKRTSFSNRWLFLKLRGIKYWLRVVTCIGSLSTWSRFAHLSYIFLGKSPLDHQYTTSHTALNILQRLLRTVLM